MYKIAVSLAAAATLLACNAVFAQGPKEAAIAKETATKNIPVVAQADKPATLRNVAASQEPSPSQRKAAFAFFLSLWHGGK